MKGLYRLEVEYGRQGTIEGVFVADSKYVDFLVSEDFQVYFGEILGKHSEVYFNVKESYVDLITTDEKVIKLSLDNGLTSGHNPLHQHITTGDLDYDYFKVKEEREVEDLTVYEFIDLCYERGYEPV